MERITVLYDEHCAVCRRCRDWLLGQRTHIPLELMAAGSPAAMARYGNVPWRGKELVVVNEHNEVWVGPAAFIMCLWATVRYREWSYRLSGPALAPMAERFFRAVSKRRLRWSSYVGGEQTADCKWCETSANAAVPPPLPRTAPSAPPG